MLPEPSNEVEAYLAGLVFTDGALGKTPGTLRLQMGEKAEPVISFLASYLGVHLSDTVPGHGHRVFSIRFRAPLGWKQIIEVPDQLLRHYVRGLIDGDGGVYIYRDAPQVRFLYAHHQREAGTFMREVLDEQHYDYTDSPHTSGSKCNVITVWKASSIEFAPWMYSDAEIALPHKMEAALCQSRVPA